MAAITDKFANLANLEITESAIGTLTFKELNTGAGIFEKMAMIIHRIEYRPTLASMELLIDGKDALEFGWVTSNQITSLAKNKAQVIDEMSLSMVLIGAAAADFMLVEKPFTVSYSDLPGGGLIVPATDLFLGCIGTSVASPISLSSSIYFTYRDLKPEEYWELVEATRALS